MTVLVERIRDNVEDYEQYFYYLGNTKEERIGEGRVYLATEALHSLYDEEGNALFEKASGVLQHKVVIAQLLHKYLDGTGIKTPRRFNIDFLGV